MGDSRLTLPSVRVTAEFDLGRTGLKGTSVGRSEPVRGMLYVDVMELCVADGDDLEDDESENIYIHTHIYAHIPE